MHALISCWKLVEKLFIFLTQNICIFSFCDVIFADNVNETYHCALRKQDIGVLWHFAYDWKNFIPEMNKHRLSFQCFYDESLPTFTTKASRHLRRKPCGIWTKSLTAFWGKVLALGRKLNEISAAPCYFSKSSCHWLCRKVNLRGYLFYGGCCNSLQSSKQVSKRLNTATHTFSSDTTWGLP